MEKVAAGFVAVMALFCVPNLIRAVFARFWAETHAEVVSSSTGYVTRSIPGTEKNESIPIQTVRVAYSYKNRSYVQELADAHAMVDVRQGDHIVVRVCPPWPSWVCRDEPSLARLGWYIGGVLFWSLLTWGLFWAAVKTWNHQP